MRGGGRWLRVWAILVEEFKSSRSSGVQEFRSSGVQEFRSSGVQEFRSSGVQGGVDRRMREKTPSATGNVGVGPKVFTAGY
jgi:hypothetical protein